ncbi:MAG: hypothetical protein GWM88_01380 [Pseudomonadales bacterium]|nr:hypothetical protein [Pseudomonadales bacterium]NIX06741.1 hypothetical protein [Pseudomonadales bacterium]
MSEKDEQEKLEEKACALLLRSPHLSVSQVLDLMDIGDLEFREMLKTNPRIASVMEQRREGALPRPESKLTECPACGDWFVPYASARCCSDTCAKIDQIRNTPDAARRYRLRNRQTGGS